MRLAPWSRSHTNGDVNGATPARALTAGGERIRISGRTMAGQARKKKEAWQDDAWAYFDSVPEVKSISRYRGAMISKVRLLAAWVPAPGELPIPLDAIEEVEENGRTVERFKADVPDAVRSAATDAIARLEQSPAGIPGILFELTVNLDVAGECYLVGLSPREQGVEAGEVIPGIDETWEIKSIDEATEVSPEVWKIADAPRIVTNGLLTPDDFICRLWQMHPRRSKMADSPVNGLIGVCEEIMILDRAARAWGLSRLNNGIIGISTDFSFGDFDPTLGDTSGQDLFQREYKDAVTTPIQDEGSASAVVPVTIFGPTEAIEKGLRHITFSRDIDDKLDTRLELRVKRLGRGLDAPVEKTIGYTETTFSNAAAITVDDFRAYLEPTIMQECASLTSGYFRPLLEAAGVPRELLRRLVVWYDPSELVAERDREPTATTAHAALVISDAKYRDELGYAETDAPSDEELLRRLGLDRGAIDPPLTELLLRLLDAALPPVERPEAVIAASTPRALTAASRRSGASLGRRLADIDRTLRIELGLAVDNATKRALEKAGARVRSKATTAAVHRSAIDGLAPVAVPATLGRAVVAALGFSEDELLEAAFDDLAEEYRSRVGRAQAAALAAMADSLDLSEDEVAELARRQEADREESWAWLLAALLAFSRTRLFDPGPESEPGEFDPLTTVPPGLVREATARAGGGVATATGEPSGGVATGRLVLDTFAQHGFGVTAWQWVYGDPSSRGTNFEGHLALDGVEFESWQDDVLAVRGEDSWLGVSHYSPGDHLWDQCSFVPVFAGTVEP